MRLPGTPNRFAGFDRETNRANTAVRNVLDHRYGADGCDEMRNVLKSEFADRSKAQTNHHHCQRGRKNHHR